MEESDKLLELRALLGETDDDDATLLFFLGQAKDAILNHKYPYMSDEEYAEMELPVAYHRKQIKIALWMLNKRGAEGEIQHIENGIHRNYKYADIPEELFRDIPPMCGLPR